MFGVIAEYFSFFGKLIFTDFPGGIIIDPPNPSPASGGNEQVQGYTVFRDGAVNRDGLSGERLHKLIGITVLNPGRNSDVDCFIVEVLDDTAPIGGKGMKRNAARAVKSWEPEL